MDVPLTILFLMACGLTIYTKGSNSLQLTSSRATASPGQPFTLMCSSSSSGGRSRDWYRRNDIIFRSRHVSDTDCQVDISNHNLYKHLSGRVTVTCSLNQYNVTLIILTSIDNGSVWWCEDTVGGQESNRLTTHVVNLMPMSTTTTTVAITTTTAASTTTTAATTSTITTTATTNIPVTSAANATTTAAVNSDTSSNADNQVVYIAAGLGGGVAVVIVVVVSVLCLRRRTGRPVNNVENDIYETSHDVTSPNQPSTNDHVITDVYAQVQKPKKNTQKPTGTADDINLEDLYAKPDKTKIRKKQED